MNMCEVNASNWDPLYPERHREVIDYSPYVLTRSGLRFRGPDPRPLTKGNYITCIGSAHTYGCFCEKPYPSLLQEKLGIPVVNLGYGGVGPSFFNRHSELIDIANNGQAVVLQVMSARCESNSRFMSEGSIVVFDRKLQKWMRAEDVWYRVLIGDLPLMSVIKKSPSLDVALRLLSLMVRHKRVEYIKQLIHESREEWMKQYRILITNLRVPKILFWFSTRSPDYQVRYYSLSLKGILGDFPQLVNREMLTAITGLCDDYVECITNEGLPQVLRNRFTGQPARIPPLFQDEGTLRLDPLRILRQIISRGSLQSYYPSQQMHERAAEVLERVLARYV